MTQTKQAFCQITATEYSMLLVERIFVTYEYDNHSTAAEDIQFNTNKFSKHIFHKYNLPVALVH